MYPLAKTEILIQLQSSAIFSFLQKLSLILFLMNVLFMFDFHLNHSTLATTIYFPVNAAPPFSLNIIIFCSAHHTVIIIHGNLKFSHIMLSQRQVFWQCQFPKRAKFQEEYKFLPSLNSRRIPSSVAVSGNYTFDNASCMDVIA